MAKSSKSESVKSESVNGSPSGQADQAPPEVIESDPQPGVGMIVHYRTGGEVWPAIITRIEPDGSLSLTAFPPGLAFRPLLGVKEGEADGQWSWPWSRE